MGFLDKARATADDLVSRADQKMNDAGLMGGQSGQSRQPGQSGQQGDPAGGAAGGKDALLHELGWITFQTEQGREAPAGRREEILTRLRELEQQPGTSTGRGPQSTSGGGGGGGVTPPPPPPSS